METTPKGYSFRAFQGYHHVSIGHGAALPLTPPEVNCLASVAVGAGGLPVGEGIDVRLARQPLPGDRRSRARPDAVSDSARSLARPALAGIADALALVGQLALVLDHFGRVLRENAAAARLYDPWLYVVGGRLAAQDREAARAFSALADVCRSGRLLTSVGGQIIVRRGERRPVVVSPLALSGAAVDSICAISLPRVGWISGVQ